MRLGDRGDAVAEVIHRLVRIGLLDEQFQAMDVAEFTDAVDAAVRTFQQDRGLTIDGIVGPQTFRRLDEARWRLGDRVLIFTPGHLMAGDDVLDLQRRLTRMGFDCGRPDGLFGPLTDSAMREFQRNVGVEQDGTCGPATFRALRSLVRTVGGGDSEQLREQLVEAAAPALVADSIIVLDPGIGPENHPEDLAIVDDIAVRVEGRLVALGAQVLLTRAGSNAPDDERRAAFANDTGADVVLSLHTTRCTSPLANGVAAYYFGDPRGGSKAGRALAELILDEVGARTDLLDIRSHARTWDLLRRTRMPAVRLELGYLSHSGDAERLANPAFRDALAEAITVGLTTYVSNRAAEDL